MVKLTTKTINNPVNTVMTEQQIPKLAGKLVEHQNFFEALSTEDAQWAIQNTQEAIALSVNAITNRVKEAANKLLKFITTFTAPATKKFVAADHFVEGKEIDGVKVAWMSDNFKNLFLPKVETDIESVTIRVHELSRNSKDLGIRTEVGEDNEEIKLAHLLAGMKAHEADDENKVGKWLIGYIIGVDGNLWAVRADRHGDGWGLSAFSVEYPNPWSAGVQVLSR